MWTVNIYISFEVCYGMCSKRVHISRFSMELCVTTGEKLHVWLMKWNWILIGKWVWNTKWKSFIHFPFSKDVNYTSSRPHILYILRHPSHSKTSTHTLIISLYCHQLSDINIKWMRILHNESWAFLFMFASKLKAPIHGKATLCVLF